ncbi:MAG: hypothetical protein Q9212_002533 [Teloschistes hypoglaucus]
MLAPSGPRASRASRPSSRARGSYQPRANRGAHTQNTTRTVYPPPSSAHGPTSTPTRPSSKNGPTRAPSSRATARGSSLRPSQSRPFRSSPRPLAPKQNDLQRDATTQEKAVYRKHMDQIFTTLGQERTQERKDAIRHGLLADPDKPTTLANAITIVGTCSDMCAEYERVQRVVQFMIDDCEKVPHATKKDVKVPSEHRMVKRYRRPAAGYEEQLPSDIRPPPILQKTLDYLMDELVGGPEPLANVHKFVWDRTRAIRNDFSIQQVTKVEELKIAISCFERIARFHILSLHQLAGVSDGSVDFDAYQEREQLNNTLLSLMYYYDDSRHKLRSPNEAEFRAYCIIFEIQDQRPDLEDRAQNWPVAILKDRRVQTALKIYADAANASDFQGPLRPQAPNALAQANTARFFAIVQSPAVPYLMACVAEIYFNKVRRTALDTIWKAYKVKRGGVAKVEDWTLSDVADALGFDDEDQAQTFCEEHGFTVAERANGEIFVDLGSVKGRHLSDTNRTRKQAFSNQIVEQKRRGRTFPAIVNGLTASQAHAQGLVEDNSQDEASSYVSSRRSSISKDDTLFLPNGPPATGSDQGFLTKAQDVNTSEAEKSSTVSPLFAPSSTFSEPLKSDTSRPTSVFGHSSAWSSSKATNQLLPSSTSQSTAAVNLTTTNNQSDPSSTSFKFPSQSGKTSSPFGTPERPDSATPNSDIAKLSSGHSPANSTPKVAPPRSILDLKPSSTNTTPSFSFATSPLFNQYDKTNDASQADTNDAKVNFPPRPSFQAGKPHQSEQKTPDSPFKFLNQPSSSSTATSFTPLVKPPNVTPAPTHDSAKSSSPRPFSSFFPPTATSISTSTPSTNQSNTPAPSFSFSPTQAVATNPNASSTQGDSARTSSQQSLFTVVASPSGLMVEVQPTSASPSTTSLFAPKSPQSTVVAPTPSDSRSAVLDTLAEGLMMDDKGLLQQFIEFTVGPIVHVAFREIEEEDSWERAREIRAVLLSRKYTRLWKVNAWKRKLLRKGRERREIFAKSMQEMARSSRIRQTRKEVLSHSNPVDSYLCSEPSKVGTSNMAPPGFPPSNLKRKSLPSDFGGDKLPDAEASNKRRRQELPRGTKHGKHFFDRSFHPHHDRLRTMVDSQKRPESIYAGKPSFRHLDANAYVNDRVLQQARRLVGDAKLDTTRTDYFQLKSRGIDPNFLTVTPSGGKRSRVDEQIERVRKLLKPKTQPDMTIGIPIKAATQTPKTTSGSSADTNGSNPPPDDLLAQIRRVREQLAEGTSWFKEEREKTERMSSSRSSEVTPNAQHNSSTQRPPQPDPSQSRQWDYAATRARLRLEKTKANGLLPPDWDWNKSVTEWKARGGVGSPRPNRESRDQSGASTPAVTQQQSKKPISLAGLSNGLGRHAGKIGSRKEEVVYDDEEEGLEDDGEENEEADEEDLVNGYEVGDEEDYDEEEYDEEEEDGEEEEEESVAPTPVVLKTQGNSAATAIDLSD